MGNSLKGLLSLVLYMVGVGKIYRPCWGLVPPCAAFERGYMW